MTRYQFFMIGTGSKIVFPLIFPPRLSTRCKPPQIRIALRIQQRIQQAPELLISHDHTIIEHVPNGLIQLESRISSSALEIIPLPNRRALPPEQRINHTTMEIKIRQSKLLHVLQARHSHPKSLDINHRNVSSVKALTLRAFQKRDGFSEESLEGCEAG